MTGYGKGVSIRDNKTITIELKSVNNRFLEINSRLPKYLMSAEDIIRKIVSGTLKRGSVDVYFDYKDADSGKTLCVDYELANLYVDAAKTLVDCCSISNEFSCAELLRMPDVVSVVVDNDVELICQMIAEAVATATTELDVMRAKEGDTIKADFLKLIGRLESHVAEVKERAPCVVMEYRDKLFKRISEYLAEVEIDEAKLINEVAFFADKVDINEEISRLCSHLEQFKEALNDSSEVGRKLDFLAQEINREVNTLGSKSNDLTLLGHVVAMKNDLEKIREQIRNVE